MQSSKYSKNYKAPYKGKFKPSNPKKYVGNTANIIYRSSWEKKFMLYCDTNPDILQWASEEMAIPYYNPIDKKVHKYYPDFIVKTASKTVMVEIKPKKYLSKPKYNQRKTKRYYTESYNYIKNTAKWKAAKEYCEDNNIEFKIFTEKELKV